MPVLNFGINKIILVRTWNVHQNSDLATLTLCSSPTGTLCILSSEMHFGWTSPSLPLLTSGAYKFRITSDEASWLAVILLAGTIVGALFTGCLADVLGRKKIILLTSVPLFAGWVLIGLADSVEELYAARFIAGLSSGISISMIPMYLGEIAEPEVRAAYSPLVLFSTFVWMPESPSFLLRKGRVEDARRTLETLRGKENADRELKRLEEAVREEIAAKPSVLELFRDQINRRAAVVAFGLRTVQQFCGTTAITFYCKTIFEQTSDFMSPNISTIVYFSLQLIIAFFASFLVDIFGRRPLLKISLYGTCSTLFLMSGFIYVKDRTDVDTSNYNVVLVLLLLLNVSSVSVGIRNIPLLMMGEMFSPSIKPIALCVGTILYSILASLSAKLFHVTSEILGMYVPFLIFAALSFLSVFFVVFYVPETKGKTLEDIQRELEGKRDECSKC
ncbi:hypothetical protein NQ318_004337 [Aromia moschata]|uniref:Major facilitator superfamily (MFS) profile domain-containing protein n=1 Tax=Aromia moschata TaxID=1265417 RepID=A0AAV8YRJ6_9CUCU|nr:hypothetical protein NQ318_004337 [Aromia moschata]